MSSLYALDLAKVKLLFFDREGVLSAAERATIKPLERFGGRVRLRSKRSIKAAPKKASTRAKRGISADGVSSPGNPPVKHNGLLGGAIFFSYDPSTRSVVIGPIRAGNSGGKGARALEQGGDSQDSKGHTIHVRARPFMRPAFEAELPNAPAGFRGMIR